MYIPLAECYKVSARNHYTISEITTRVLRSRSFMFKQSPMVRECYKIINSLTDKKDNSLKSWALSNKYNMLHLVRFLRIIHHEYYSLEKIGIDSASIRSFNSLDTKTNENQLTIDNKIVLIINGNEILLEDVGKKRDNFLKVCPIDFEITDDVFLNNIIYLCCLNEIEAQDVLPHLIGYGFSEDLKIKDEELKRIIALYGKNSEEFWDYIRISITPRINNKFQEFINENKKFM